MNPLASRLLASTQPVTVGQLEAQELQRVAVLPQLAWTEQLEALRGMKSRLEGWSRARGEDEEGLEAASERLFHAPIETVMRNVAKTAGSAVLRVTNASLEVLAMVVRALGTRESVERLADCATECVKLLLGNAFMSAENANSRVVVDLISDLLRFQSVSLNESLLCFFTHSLQTSSLSASSPTFLSASLLRFVALIVALHPDLLLAKPDRLRLVIDASYQCLLTNSTVLLRLVRDLFAQLAQTCPHETVAVLQTLTTSKKTVFLDFADKFKIDDAFFAALKSAKKNTRSSEPAGIPAGASSDRAVESTITLSKPVHFEPKSKIQSRIPFQKSDSGNSNISGYSELSTTFEESEEPSLPRVVSVLPLQKTYLSPQLTKRVGSHVQPVEKRINDQTGKAFEQPIQNEKQNANTQIDPEEAFHRLQIGQGGKREMDCVVQAISRRQFCSLLAFNQLWNTPSPFLVIELI